MPRSWELDNADRLAAALTTLKARTRSSGERIELEGADLGEISIRVITLDEVIASKEALGRPKDTAALPALYATREALRRRKTETRAGREPERAGLFARPFDTKCESRLI